MARIIYTFLTITFSIYIQAQSLSLERINKIKDATVKIILDSSSSSGTGFFIDSNGTIGTCWHVVAPAVQVIANKTYSDNIKIQTRDGSIFTARVLPRLVDKYLNELKLNDICLLYIIDEERPNFKYLKVGNYDNLEEGQEVFTCGYPLNLKQQFVSKGIVSTKMLDSSGYIEYPNRGRPYRKYRIQSLLDLTLNPGNSGGAIVVADKNNEDVVIGIADFIINPIGSTAQAAINRFLRVKSIGSFTIGGFDQQDANIYFTEMMREMSVGISGCVSINPMMELYKVFLKK